MGTPEPTPPSVYGEGNGGFLGPTTADMESVADAPTRDTVRTGADGEGRAGEGSGVAESIDAPMTGAGVGDDSQESLDGEMTETGELPAATSESPPTHSPEAADTLGNVVGSSASDRTDLGIASDRGQVAGVHDADAETAVDQSFLDQPVADPAMLAEFDPINEPQDALADDEDAASMLVEVGGVFVLEEETIKIPTVEVEQRDDAGFIREVGGVAPPTLSEVLRGAWEQEGAPPRSHADFAPGGYTRRAIAFDPASGTLTVVQEHGPAGIVAGEHRFRVDGRTLEFAGPVEGAEFPPRSPGVVALGGDYRSPTNPLPLAHRVEFIDGVLRLEDKRYIRMDAESYRAMLAGNAGRASNATPIPPSPDGGRRTIDFFGIPSGASRICFIIDRSPSMAFQWNGVIRELKKVVESFTPRTRFEIVFFGGTRQADTIDGPGWSTGTAAARSKVLSALDGVLPNGSGTDPDSAFQYAFESLDPQPDVIVLLTDGQVSPGTADVLRGLNIGIRRTRINTLGMGTVVNEPLLRQIAAEHGGTYRLIQ